jgi:IS30 family transposase
VTRHPRRPRLPFDILDELFRLLLIDTWPRSAIAEHLNINRKTVIAWARRLGLPDRPPGRIPTMPTTIVAAPAPPRPTAYHHLTVEDRMTIQAGLQSDPPLSVRAIAGQLGVAASTVSREIRRNRIIEYDKTSLSPVYSAAGAHGRAHVRQARKTHRPKRLDDPWLRAHVINGLNDRCSPQQVAGRLRRDYPDRKDLHVSHETVYQALYVQGRGSLRHELAVVKALRSGRTGRKPQSKLPRRTSRPWLDGALLTDRPPQAADRSVPGHWEGDLVVDSHTGGLVTVIERRSRFSLIRKLPNNRESATVTGLVQDMIASLPEALFSTLTWDQGQEMAEHPSITVATDCQVYFCDPHSPWQRPTNENTNGLVRDYYPKGTLFDESITDEEIQAMQDQLNRRPRKVLGFATPAEVLADLLHEQVA